VLGLHGVGVRLAGAGLLVEGVGLIT
jgi:hypothetical protein